MKGLKNLSLATLGEMNHGMCGVSFGEALGKVQADLASRPDLAGKRKVQVELVFTPVLDKVTQRVGEIEIGWNISTKLPSNSMSTRALVEEDTTDGGETTTRVMFRGLVPEDARQAHLTDELDEDATKPRSHGAA